MCRNVTFSVSALTYFRPRKFRRHAKMPLPISNIAAMTPSDAPPVSGSDFPSWKAASLTASRESHEFKYGCAAASWNSPPSTSVCAAACWPRTSERVIPPGPPGRGGSSSTSRSYSVIVLTLPSGFVTSTLPSAISPGFVAMAVGVAVQGGLAVFVGLAVAPAVGEAMVPSAVAVCDAVAVAVAVGEALVGSG